MTLAVDLALDRRTLLVRLAQAGVAVPYVAAGLGCVPSAATAQPKPRPRYHWTLLRTGAPADVPGLLAPLADTLGSHKLVGETAFEAWTGDGPLPVYCSETAKRAMRYDYAHTRAGNSVSEVLAPEENEPIQALEIAVYAPIAYDISAYAEILHFVLSLARKVGAKVVVDGSVSEYIDIAEFESYPAKLSDFDIDAAHVRINYSALQARELKITGLIKCGLPDIFLPHGLYGEKSIVLAKLIAASLLFGLPIENGVLRIPMSDIGRPDAYFVATPVGDRVAMRLAPEGQLSQHEQQQALWLALLDTDFGEFPLLRRADAAALSMAIAKLHSMLESFTGDQWSATRSAGKVFVRKHVPGTVQPANPSRDGMTAIAASRQFAWFQALDWRDPARIEAQVWDGDPRRGGRPVDIWPRGWLDLLLFVLRNDPEDNPLQHNTISEDEIVDVLIIRPDGTSEGGEISALAERLAKAAPKP